MHIRTNLSIVPFLQEPTLALTGSDVGPDLSSPLILLSGTRDRNKGGPRTTGSQVYIHGDKSMTSPCHFVTGWGRSVIVVGVSQR